MTTPTDTSGYTWGVFNDEGMLAGQLSYASARAEVDAADPDDELIVDRECSDHPEQRASTCEDCFSDEDEEEEDEEEEEELDA